LQEEAVSLKKKAGGTVSPKLDRKSRSKNTDLNVDESVNSKSKSRKVREDESQGKSIV
jgi:hypothetical protein